jgi:hypothetical protein
MAVQKVKVEDTWTTARTKRQTQYTRALLIRGKNVNFIEQRQPFNTLYKEIKPMHCCTINLKQHYNST